MLALSLFSQMPLHDAISFLECEEWKVDMKMRRSRVTISACDGELRFIAGGMCAARVSTNQCSHNSSYCCCC